MSLQTELPILEEESEVKPENEYVYCPLCHKQYKRKVWLAKHRYFYLSEDEKENHIIKGGKLFRKTNLEEFV